MWLLLVAMGAKKPPAVWETGDAPSVRGLSIAVAPVVRVAVVPAPALEAPAPPGEIESQLGTANLPPPTVLDPERDGAFLRNEYVGNIRFGGGFVRTGSVQLEVRARLIELNDQERYEAQGRAWLTGTVDALLADRKLEASSAPLFVPDVDRVTSRGLHPYDGRDNLNLPRTALRARDAVGPVDAAGADYLLVPLLRTYYTHNGGWFLGQEYGCMAGARVEAMLVLYEADTGKVVWTVDAVGRHLQPRDAQPSRAEADQYLLWAEDQVEQALDKHFL